MPTVLLIEDDVESRKRVARLFTRHGWEVIEALEGRAGIDLAFAKRPDAIICDLLLPKMSGLQVCRAIREKLDLTKIIITAVAVTTSTATRSWQRAAMVIFSSP